MQHASLLQVYNVLMCVEIDSKKLIKLLRVKHMNANGYFIYMCHVVYSSSIVIFFSFLDVELYYTGGKEGVKKKAVFTIAEMREVLHYHHSNAMGGHSGVNSTLNKISNYYWWNGMKEDVHEYVMAQEPNKSVRLPSHETFRQG